MTTGVYIRTEKHIAICRKAGKVSAMSLINKNRYASRWETRTCAYCGGLFNVRKVLKKQYCSRDCSNKCPVRNQKISNAMMGSKCHTQKHTDEAKLKMSKAKLGKHISPLTEFKKGHKPSENRTIHYGENHYRFKHGRGSYKTIIRRNGIEPICSKCDKVGEFGHKIHVHHIDEDRNNNEVSNLIVLCSMCHSHHHKNWNKR